MNENYSYLGSVEAINRTVQLPVKAFEMSGIQLPCEIEMDYDFTKDLVLIYQVEPEKNPMKFRKKVSADDMSIEVPEAVEKMLKKLEKPLEDTVFIIFADSASHSICLKIISAANLFKQNVPDNRPDFSFFEEIPSEKIVLKALEKLIDDSKYQDLLGTKEYLQERLLEDFDEETFEEFVDIQNAISMFENKYMIKIGGDLALEKINNIIGLIK